MNINADQIRLQFDDFILAYHASSGWSVSRGGHMVIYRCSWEEAWAAMTLGERVKCIVFANQLR